MAELVKEALKRAAPDTASVEFGMDVKVEAGKLTGLLVGGSASASLKVTLGWTGDAAASLDHGDGGASAAAPGAE